MEERIDMDLKILIADDDIADRKQLQRTIGKLPYKATIFDIEAADSAYDICEKHNLDLAIFDYNMPSSDVLKTITSLHKKYPHMALIMVTGQGDEVIATEAFKAGVTDYLPKNAINVENMERCISNAIEKSTLKKKIDEQRVTLQRYAHVLAHDLRSPAAQIVSFLQMVELAVNSGDQENMKTYMDFSTKAANHILDLVEALSEYNKIDGGETTFERSEMKDVIQDALNYSEIYINDRNAKVTIEGDMPSVICNKPQMVQLIQNLVNNGIKYNRDDNPRIYISSKETDEGWQFSIKDNGIGIPEKHQKNIFNMFARLHSQGGDFDGSGIGLATCQKIVYRHDGKIWCESTQGDGTTFHFTLPVNSERHERISRAG